MYGRGKPTRDYVYVADVVSALLAAAGRSGTYNIATGVETDVMTIWRELQEVAVRVEAGRSGVDPGRLEPELADLRPGELRRSRLDVGLAERELGWRAQVQISEGLRLTYEALVEEFERA